MTAGVEVDDSQVMRRLNEVLKAVNDPKPLMKVLAGTLEAIIHEEFDTQGHGTWAPLKHRRGVPLQDTRRLYNSITSRYDAASATVGTNVVYAALQNYGAKKGQFGKTSRGASIPWGDVPARSFTPTDKDGNLKPSAAEQLLAALERYMRKRR